LRIWSGTHPRSLPIRGDASHEVRSPEVLCAGRVWVIGFATSGTARLFPCEHVSLVTSRPLSVLPGSFPRLLASSEFLRSLSHPDPFGTRIAARVSSLFATSLEQVHSLQGFPSPCYVPSAGAHNLSTAFSLLQLAGLFHPAAASRDSMTRSGVWALYHSHPSSSEGGCPLVVGSPNARSTRSRRPRSACLDFEAFIRVEIALPEVGD
jgi:hypothetical protein